MIYLGVLLSFVVLVILVTFSDKLWIVIIVYYDNYVKL